MNESNEKITSFLHELKFFDFSELVYEIIKGVNLFRKLIKKRVHSHPFIVQYYWQENQDLITISRFA